MLDRLYGKTRRTAIGGLHRARLTREVVGSVELHRATLAMRFEAEAPPLNAVVVTRLLSGTISYRTITRSNDYAAGDVYLAGKPSEAYRVAIGTVDARFVMITPSLIDEIASAAPGRKGEGVRFTNNEPVDGRAAKVWNRAHDYACRSSRSAASAPFLAQGISLLLAAAALSAFPNTALRDPTIEDRHDAHPASLRRAIAFIDENAHRGISPADIADAAHISIRAVQLAFRRHLDTTPMTYLRRVRLERAHRELLAADPSTDTVAAVAARWGFDNHSRFTAQYRAAYGDAPSRSLRR